ncbi:DUF1320 domain-containing protein [Chromobacterium haemolyticum]|uniref:DUF1320 domain-containing protein n=1 Tax=Chromobacterium fluminis TaxID=3044269 RepID=A0ABX0LEH2_9NEIS|nr:DUF1320 domain-containing protein [Chromobacterium haemolyticum]NHR08031.1 DUF1320 domain-containing protein [Chromobacterium haemolyticum]
MTASSPYITAADLEARFGRGFLLNATDPTNTGEIDADKVAQAIADATSLINSYVGKRYLLPVPTVPDALQRIAADLVRYFLFDSPSDDIAKRHDAAQRWLRDVSSGVVSLGLPEALAPASAVGAVVVDGPPRLFSRKTMENY